MTKSATADAAPAQTKKATATTLTATSLFGTSHLGATGLTFYDDDVTEFLAPGTGLSPMLCVAVGVDARRRR